MSITEKFRYIVKHPFTWTFDVIIDHAWYAVMLLLWGSTALPLKFIEELSLSNSEKILIGCIFILCILLVAVIRKLKITYQDNVDLSELLQSFGVKGFYPYTTLEERKAEWAKLVHQFNKNDPQNLKILALNGWETFASPESPLHNYLKKFKGDLTILLIEPNCEACTHRTNSIDSDNDHFKLDHKSSIEFCKELKLKGINIRLFYYSQQPIWKMIETESYIWLQHYDKFSHVDKSPVYEFYKDTDKTSLYFPLAAIIEKKINHDGNKEIPLGDETLTPDGQA